MSRRDALTVAGDVALAIVALLTALVALDRREPVAALAVSVAACFFIRHARTLLHWSAGLS